jgi:hypothetical protein
MHDGQAFELDASAWPMMAGPSFPEDGPVGINIGTYDPKNQI